MKKWVVKCKGCGNMIDLKDEHVPTGGKTVDFPNMAWRARITCECGATHDYKGDDLKVLE